MVGLDQDSSRVLFNKALNVLEYIKIGVEEDSDCGWIIFFSKLFLYKVRR